MYAEEANAPAPPRMGTRNGCVPRWKVRLLRAALDSMARNRTGNEAKTKGHGEDRPQRGSTCTRIGGALPWGESNASVTFCLPLWSSEWRRAHIHGDFPELRTVQSDLHHLALRCVAYAANTHCGRIVGHQLRRVEQREMMRCGRCKCAEAAPTLSTRPTTRLQLRCTAIWVLRSCR